jgi:foldase protein PrsA
MATNKTAKKATMKTPAAKPTTKTTVKKVSEKTTVKSTVPVAKTDTEKTTSPSTTQTVKLRKSYVALIIIIVLLGAALYYYRGLFVAAVVNGQPISRLEVVEQAEKQSGKTTLDTLVRDALIEQEAKKENVTVSDSEVNSEISQLSGNLQKQGQTLNQVLVTQGMTEDDLRNLIRLDKLVQKMVSKNVTVSNTEVNDYIAKNKASLPNVSGNALKQQVKSELLQQKTNDAVQAWLANLQAKAHVVYFVQYQ